MHICGGDNMKELDEQEKKILTELVRNPRISDNQIGKNTNIPVKTVNRKRKILEERGVVHYFTFLNHGERGTGIFTSQYMYIVKLKYGITTLRVSQKFYEIMNNKALTKHTLFSSIGEDNGHVVLVFVLESGKQEDMVEIFNAEIVPTIGNFFGAEAIVDVKSIAMRRNTKLLHNYMPGYNMEKGIIKKDWPNENLFIF